MAEQRRVEQHRGEQTEFSVVKTLRISFTFFIASLFWPIYNSYVPLFLDYFYEDQLPKNAIMTIDNVFALTVIPLFAFLSDLLDYGLEPTVALLNLGFSDYFVPIVLDLASWLHMVGQESIDLACSPLARHGPVGRAGLGLLDPNAAR